MDKTNTYGENICEPVKFSLDQEKVCEYLDAWYEDGELVPSELLKGAIAVQSECNKKNNPDWIAQSANSIREIFYKLGDEERPQGFFKRLLSKLKKLALQLKPSKSDETNKRKTIKDRIEENVLMTESENAKEITDLLEILYRVFTSIAHHRLRETKYTRRLKKHFGIELVNEQDFKSKYGDLIDAFVNLLKRMTDNIIEIHKKMDSFFKLNDDQLKRNEIQILIASHYHARSYFYSHAPISWISWLHENKFFEVLKTEASNKSKILYSIPELSYLSRVVAEQGDEGKVSEIMCQVDTHKNFNPEVVYRFLGICQQLSVKNLAKIIPKINKENWVRLMRNFDESGYSYDKIIQKLSNAKDYKNLILLAEVLLTPQENEGGGFLTRGHFIVKDLSETGIFNALLNLEGKGSEEALKVVGKTLSSLVSENDDASSVFPFSDTYYINDVDFFDLKLEEPEIYKFKEDIKSLLKIYVELIRINMGVECSEKSKIIFQTYIEELPDSQTLWRAKLFAMSCCPKLFKDQLYKELNRIFGETKYGQLLFGTEYVNTLKRVFHLWEEHQKKEYVKKALGMYRQLINDRPDEHWRVRQGWEILSSISQSLEDEEKEEAEQIFKKKLDKSFTPKVTEHEITGGMVQDRSPISFESFGKIKEVIEALKVDLDPEVLAEKYKGDHFLSPRNTEGVGNELRNDMKRRMNQYTSHAVDFFDEDIHIHYVYSYLRGIEEYLREKNELTSQDWTNLFLLFDKIKRSEKRNSDTTKGKWLASWSWIEKSIAEILRYFLSEDYKHDFDEKREDALKLIEYLIESEDPLPEHETDGNQDLYFTAINSVRGVTFQALADFVCRDGEELKPDVLKLYLKIIEEASPSVRFVIGRYLAVFYFRAKDQVGDMLNVIFPMQPESFAKFYPTWEGFLQSGVHEELFDRLREQYEYALGLDANTYPKSKQQYDVDEGIGRHLALAFAHFESVTYTETEKHPLLEALFNGENVKRITEFISFLGRGVVSNGNIKEWLKEKKVSIQKLMDLWELLLAMDLGHEVYSAFGLWVNHEEDIFDYNWLANIMARTMIKSKGVIDWDHGLEKRMLQLAKANPRDTLTIAKQHFLIGLLAAQRMNWYHLDEDTLEAFRLFYKEQPEETKELINTLLKKGGRPFWPLKDIINED